MTCRRLAFLASIGLAGAAAAQTAGPPAPVAPKTTPAQQAIALYHQRNDPPPPPKPCRQQRGQDEITVCGNPGDRSPYRDPLPEERLHHAGELPNVDIGTGPVPVIPGVTVVRFGMSKANKERGATLKVIAAQEQAKADRDARAQSIETVTGADGSISVRTDDDPHS